MFGKFLVILASIVAVCIGVAVFFGALLFLTAVTAPSAKAEDRTYNEFRLGVNDIGPHTYLGTGYRVRDWLDVGAYALYGYIGDTKTVQEPTGRRIVEIGWDRERGAIIISNTAETRDVEKDQSSFYYAGYSRAILNWKSAYALLQADLSGEKFYCEDYVCVNGEIGVNLPPFVVYFSEKGNLYDNDHKVWLFGLSMVLDGRFSKALAK